MNLESMKNFNVGTSVSGKCISHKERCANNSEAPSGLSGKRPYLYAMFDNCVVNTAQAKPWLRAHRNGRIEIYFMTMNTF